MIQTKEKTIDDMKVIVSEFPARYGFRLQTKLIRIFGPVLGELISGISTKGKGPISKSDIDLSKLSSSIQILFDKLNDDEAEELMFKLLAHTKIDGQDVNKETFDLMFPGKYSTLYKTIGFVLEVNYSSFFGKGGIGKVFKNLMTKMPSMPLQN